MYIIGAVSNQPKPVRTAIRPISSSSLNERIILGHMLLMEIIHGSTFILFTVFDVVYLLANLSSPLICHKSNYILINSTSCTVHTRKLVDKLSKRAELNFALANSDCF